MELNRLIEHFAATLFRVRGVYCYTIAAGSYGTQKSAPYPGFIFPLAGCAEYRFNNTPYLATTETVVHGLADCTMHKRVVGERSWEFISVLYETYKEPCAISLAKTHFSVTIGPNPHLPGMLHQLYAVSNRPGGLPAFQTETMFRRILQEVFLSAGNQAKHGVKELFESVSEYIHAHYMDAVTVSLLAAQHGTNENRLFYVFQKCAGMGPGDYLRAYRLNRARDLLVTSTLPVGTIAEQVGYADPLYFSRIFKKHFGAPPSKYREI